MPARVIREAGGLYQRRSEVSKSPVGLISDTGNCRTDMPKIDMLSRGYFPKELPNPFHTESLATVMTTAGLPQPAGFVLNPAARDGDIPVSAPEKYSLARGGLRRRQLSVPNPLSISTLS